MSDSDGSVPHDAWLRRNPSHPGRLLYHGCMEAVEGIGERMTVGEAARKLGVSRSTVSRVLHGRSGIAPALALKLESVGWGTADMWLCKQARYDLARARNSVGEWLSVPELNSAKHDSEA